MDTPLINIVRSKITKSSKKPALGRKLTEESDKSIKESNVTLNNRTSVWKKLKGKFAGDKGTTKNSKKIPAKSDNLFRNNPEIPEIAPSKTIYPINEPVFSKCTFSQFQLHPHLVKNLSDQGFTIATAVQAKVIPEFLHKKELLVRSQTGSGKTLAFALPLVHLLMNREPKIQRSDGIYGVIIVPTRELATQTYQIVESLTKACTWIVPGAITGGEKRKAEKARLRKGLSILVATPGRLLDHIQHTACLSLDHVEFLIIDEADRLLDLGYEKDVAEIIRTLNKHQLVTSLYSATLSEGVERLAGLALKKPVRISCIDDQEEDPTAAATHNKIDDPLALPSTLRNEYVVTPAKLRLATLAAFVAIHTAQRSKAIIFIATVEMVELHTALLRAAVPNALLYALHGSMPQQQRRDTYLAFRKAKSAIMICTDVAARGLDLPSVDWVVQYTAPISIAEYIHRAGRTARSGQSGSSLLFLIPSEINFVHHLEESRIVMAPKKIEYLLEEAQLYADGNTAQEVATKLQHDMESLVNEDENISQLSRKAFMSWTRFYATYPRQLKSKCFNLKSVHLGHFAKSFALKETPSEIMAKSSQPPPPVQPKIRKRRNDNAAVSEFSSGLTPLKKLRGKKLNDLQCKC